MEFQEVYGCQPPKTSLCIQFDRAISASRRSIHNPLLAFNLPHGLFCYSIEKIIATGATISLACCVSSSCYARSRVLVLLLVAFQILVSGKWNVDLFDSGWPSKSQNSYDQEKFSSCLSILNKQSYILPHW